MAKWLSDEWFDRMRDLTADQPDHPGLSARIQAASPTGAGEWSRRRTSQ
jgi:hypothetical protein